MPPASHDTTDSPVFVNWDSSPLTKPAWVFAFERRTQANPQYQQYVLFGVDYIKTLMVVRSEEHYVIVNLGLLGKSYTVKDPFPLNATEAYLSLTADPGERAARVIALAGHVAALTAEDKKEFSVNPRLLNKLDNSILEDLKSTIDNVSSQEEMDGLGKGSGITCMIALRKELHIPLVNK